jgi:hypothetical protein
MSPSPLRRLTHDPSPEPHYAEPYGPADEELEWFFTMAESSMGRRSNFEDSLRIQRHRRDQSESHVEAVRAHRVILERLRGMGDPRAGVLQAAYTARAWPVPLLLTLGRHTGIVVRLATAEIGLLDDSHLARVEEDVARGLVETLYKEEGKLAPLRELAATYFDDAYDAYRRKRGRSRSLARRFR